MTFSLFDTNPRWLEVLLFLLVVCVFLGRGNFDNLPFQGRASSFPSILDREPLGALRAMAQRYPNFALPALNSALIIPKLYMFKSDRNTNIHIYIYIYTVIWLCLGVDIDSSILLVFVGHRWHLWFDLRRFLPWYEQGFQPEQWSFIMDWIDLIRLQIRGFVDDDMIYVIFMIPKTPQKRKQQKGASIKGNTWVPSSINDAASDQSNSWIQISFHCLKLPDSF